MHAWVSELDHQGRDLDFIMCEETVEGKTTTFAPDAPRFQMRFAKAPP